MTNRSSAAILKAIREKDSAYWEQVRKRRALDLFHRAAKEVPAYKDFLKKHKVDPNSIKSHEDLKLVPPTSKDNYLRQYKLTDLTWGGHLDHPLVYTSTSGSTGFVSTGLVSTGVDTTAEEPPPTVITFGAASTSFFSLFSK